MNRRSLLTLLPFLPLLGKVKIQNEKNLDSFSIPNRPHPDNVFTEESLRYFHKQTLHAEHYCTRKFKFPHYPNFMKP